MHHKLTKRLLISVKKGQAKKEKREELKLRRAQRALDDASRRPPPPRRKDWWAAAEDEYATEDGPGRGPPMRQAPGTPPPAPAALPATVIEVRSVDSLVAQDGRILCAKLGRAAGGTLDRSPLAVGDRVMVEPAGDGLARIVSVLDRRTALTRDVHDPSRRHAHHQRQVLAANIDQVIVVCSAEQPPFRPRLIDRYLVASSRDGLPAAVCLNKTDLGVSEDVEWYLAGYLRLGVPVLRLSVRTGAGLPALASLLEGRVSLLSGHSGVGKSSLLNALEPGLGLRVGDVTHAAAGQAKGRHTTSSARLIPLSMRETYVVDTPGIRAFGLGSLDPRDLAAHFPDVAALAAGCAFRDCLHAREAGCAVALAASSDRFLRERLESYRGLLEELG